MRLHLYGLAFVTSRVTFYLWSPWRCALLEHKLFESIRQLPGVKILNSDDPEQSCGIGFISIDGFDATKLAAYLWQKYRIWTTAIVTPARSTSATPAKAFPGAASSTY